MKIWNQEQQRQPGRSRDASNDKPSAVIKKALPNTAQSGERPRIEPKAV
jgi:hypothetical protein